MQLWDYIENSEELHASKLYRKADAGGHFLMTSIWKLVYEREADPRPPKPGPSSTELGADTGMLGRPRITPCRGGSCKIVPSLSVGPGRVGLVGWPMRQLVSRGQVSETEIF